MLGLMLHQMFGCAEPIEEVFTDCSGETEYYLISRMAFSSIERNRTWGYDLDDTVSDGTETDECGGEDFVSHSGEPGIDNAFSDLLDTLTSAPLVDDELINKAINQGRILILIEISGLESHFQDDCVQVALHKAGGDLLFDIDENLLDGQTYFVNPNESGSVVTDIPLSEGQLDALPIVFSFPMPVLDCGPNCGVGSTTLPLDLIGGMHISFTQDKRLAGFVSGSVPLDLLTGAANQPDSGYTVSDLDIINSASDIRSEETGECDKISMTIEFEAVRAHIFDNQFSYEWDQEATENSSGDDEVQE